MENKLKVIDAICKRHPAYGVEKGWSKYVGGMTDSGEWFVRKMLDVPINELQSFLDSIIFGEEHREKHREKHKHEWEEIIFDKNGCWHTSSSRDVLKGFYGKIENEMLYGKRK